MVVALHDRGLFSWDEWANALSKELKRPDALDDASDYYHAWLAALESIIATKNIAGRGDIDRSCRRLATCCPCDAAWPTNQT